MNLGSMLNLARRRGVGRLLILDYAQEAHIDPGELAWQLQFIARQLRPIAISRLMGHLGGKRLLEGTQVSVVFSGEECLGADAAELLRQLAFPATLFVPLGEVQEQESGARPRPAWQARLHALVAAGLEVGHLHCDPPRPLDEGPARRSRLAAWRRNAELRLGTQVQAFAYAAPVAADPALLRDAAIAGFNLGLAPTAGTNALRPIDPMRLHRHAVTRETTRAQFESLLANLAHRP